MNKVFSKERVTKRRTPVATRQYCIRKDKTCTLIRMPAGKGLLLNIVYKQGHELMSSLCP